ncbi:ferrous iron transport protein A [Thermosyntropha lipolytica DSM 11003]|uniref:Ferrous iron transport protein A n=1 Tax=Thermosyntropha lipolytica DSM 11003 TaxID=1123382 RepID=A0A1M5N3W0_9FIRM|nr:FeoA family protein [Thermosyntropha lipolytica]SHG84135.1 ferrous iron transport protein A [Thermosyntropha lipolytica DSM 11003]
MRLSQLQTGESGVIKEVRLEGFVRRRLLDLGFVPGTAVKSIRQGPGGSPIVFEVRDTLIALRAKEAGKILIAK